MPKIQVLDKQVAELIAAGEVVERPSSVIKELVENSIDAGASVITVEIRHGGVTFMRVTDNGCGIEPEDVPTAFLRHATSKIFLKGDLDAISTLGFRGEALASISAVSRVELLTRTHNAPAGVRYVEEGAAGYSLEEAGCPEGTTILVRDLFYNTPARMKFLKKDVTEGNSVAGILEKMALSHPEISFRLIRDGKETLHTPGDNQISSAIYAVYGRDFSSELIPVEYELEHIKVMGAVCTPAGCRPNRSMQNFFINGRYVRSRTAMAALEEAYKGSIMVGKFPSCALHLQLALGTVDVNVHPAKMEVRFVNERPVFNAVYHAVKSALQQGDKPKIMELKKPVYSPFQPVNGIQEQTVIPQPPALKARSPQLFSGVLQDSGAPIHEKPHFYSDFERILDHDPQPEAAAAEKIPIPNQALREKKNAETFHTRILGEAFGTYIIVEYSGDELMFIDKHAAHERLLYERLKSENRGGEAQTLLEPVSVTLSKDEYTAVLSHTEELSKVGFEVEDFGAGSVLVRSAPLLLDGRDATEALMEIAGYLVSFKTDLTTEHLDWVYHNVACRAAVKAGDTTSREELVYLAEQLEQNPEVRYCPHGRPVYILLRRRDIERQFGRI